MFHTDHVNINIKSKLKENLMINYPVIDEGYKLGNARESIKFEIPVTYTGQQVCKTFKVIFLGMKYFI